MFDLEVRVVSSEAEALAYMHSPEVQSQTEAYINWVHERCTAGLSEANRKLYKGWHKGTYRPTSEEQLRTAKENPELYGAIMESISWGLG